MQRLPLLVDFFRAILPMIQFTGQTNELFLQTSIIVMFVKKVIAVKRLFYDQLAVTGFIAENHLVKVYSRG